MAGGPPPLLSLRSAAVELLDANDAGGYTVPARATYPHQWNWDSALAALGWAELDPDRAWTELETLAGTRDASGMFPHIAFRPSCGSDYLPGPRWWGMRAGADGRRISGLTQPPLAATCMRILFEEHADEQRARRLLRPLLRWHRFLLSMRDPSGLGEPVLIHPWESGRDNAVEWDAPLWRVAPELDSVRRRDVESVAANERPTNEHYRRYLTLVRHGTAAGWGQEQLARCGAFRVLDPGFSAILARAAVDLGWLAEQLGEHWIADQSRADAERVSSALRARADADGLVRAFDLVSEETIDVTSAGSALAVLAPGLAQSQINAIRELVLDGALSSPFGVRSLDREHPALSRRNYWRGPTWANVTWLCAWSFAARGDHITATELRHRMVEAIECGGLREYFAPDSGNGLGASDFTWTAALYLRELGRQLTIEPRFMKRVSATSPFEAIAA